VTPDGQLRGDIIAKIAGQPVGNKPRKPRPDFPPFPHASGRRAKKVLGRFRYLGKVADDTHGGAVLET
jgi:hypothetical protein